MDRTIWTIGHSTRTFDELLALLQSARIEGIADVRRFPKSRRLPHFERRALGDALGGAGIAYTHIERLGGRRRVLADSPNTAWRNASFRGYADYMGTPDFHAGIRELVELASQRRTAMMCAEVLWWRCHRALVSDFLKAAGYEVLHITDRKIEAHPFTSAARMIDGKLTYAAADDDADAAGLPSSKAERP